MKILSLLLFAFLPYLLRAQISAKPALPDSALFRERYTGNVQQLFSWTDKAGQHYLVLTVTDHIRSKVKTSQFGEDCYGSCTDRELYAYHFIGKDSLAWKVQDFERNCNYDNLVDFRPNATRITDLDRDGIAEVWFMYTLTCTSDVSPRSMKLILYQGSRKYAIRGTSQPSPKMTDPEYGGKRMPDKAFLSLPEIFRKYGETLWTKNLYDHK